MCFLLCKAKIKTQHQVCDPWTIMWENGKPNTTKYQGYCASVILAQNRNIIGQGYASHCGSTAKLKTAN